MVALVTGARAAGQPAEAGLPLHLVWIDSREAVIVTGEHASDVERVPADIPDHRRATGHRRVKMFVGHGARGPEAGHPDHERLEHRRAFLVDVSHRIPAAAHVMVLGPGPLRDHLVTLLHEERARVAVGAVVEAQACGPQTDRQLVARYRELAGMPPRRVRRAS